jgi:hypothetical protein
MEKMSEDQHSSKNHLKSDFFFDQTADSHRLQFWAHSWDFISSAKTNSVVGIIRCHPPQEVARGHSEVAVINLSDAR